MFTGIVEHMGRILSSGDASGVRTVVVDTGPLADIGVGDSLSVNGVCLTAITVDQGRVNVEIVAETLSRTSLGSIRVDEFVNLERAMPVTGRFDGHIVQGHVDGTATVMTAPQEANGYLHLRIEDQALLKYVVEKGSITVDGVSLTIAQVFEDGFAVALIPHTLATTTLGGRNPGDKVNVEVDILAKYLERLVGS